MAFPLLWDVIGRLRLRSPVTAWNSSHLTFTSLSRCISAFHLYPFLSVCFLLSLSSILHPPYTQLQLSALCFPSLNSVLCVISFLTLDEDKGKVSERSGKRQGSNTYEATMSATWPLKQQMDVHSVFITHLYEQPSSVDSRLCFLFSWILMRLRVRWKKKLRENKNEKGGKKDKQQQNFTAYGAFYYISVQYALCQCSYLYDQIGWSLMLLVKNSIYMLIPDDFSICWSQIQTYYRTVEYPAGINMMRKRFNTLMQLIWVFMSFLKHKNN